MRRTKKVLAVLLAGAIMASALCACGEEKEEATEAKTEAVTEATTTTANETTESVTEATTEAETEAEAETDSNESSEPSQTDYSAGTTEDAATVEAFALKIRTAVEDSDWETLADMAQYPVMVNGAQVASKDELLSSINEKGVSDEFISKIKGESCTGMMANGQGVMMADGEVWFTDSFEGKGLVIITFNGLYK